MEADGFGVDAGSTVGSGVDAFVHLDGEDGPPRQPRPPPPPAVEVAAAPLPPVDCLHHPRHCPPIGSLRLLLAHET